MTCNVSSETLNPTIHTLHTDGWQGDVLARMCL